VLVLCILGGIAVVVGTIAVIVLKKKAGKKNV
jgi:hypothetical protein